MKRLLSLLLLTMLAVSWAKADQGGYSIIEAQFEATVHENNVWDVTETLHVYFTEPRHGIYRHVPTVFMYENNKYKNKISDINVEGYNFKVSDNDDSDDKLENKIIQIGSSRTYVEGMQTYVITYKLQFFDDRLSDYDFINYSVWGPDWDAPVEKFSFNIKFDKTLPADLAQNLNVCSGEYGRTDNAAGVIVKFDKAKNTISGYVESLPNKNAITISAKLPEGYWKPESKNLSQLYISLGVFALIACVFLFKIFSYRRRDPMRVVEFYPPDGISSAEVGKIIDDSSDLIDLASLIPWFAHQGYIRITEIPDRRGRYGGYADLKLEKLAPLLPDAPAYQKTFMKAIFGSQKTVLLSDLGDCHYEIDLSKKQLDKVYSGERKLTDVSGSLLYWFLMLLAAMGVMWTSNSIDTYSSGLALQGLFSGIGAALIIGFIRLVSAPKRSIRSSKSKIIEAVVCACLYAAGVGIAMYIIPSYRLCFSPVYLYIGFAVIALISYMVDRTTVDTKYRLEIMGRLLGLRDFIKTAEQQRLKMLVDENPQYFYDILPYAMVFGLSDKWAEQFSNIQIQNPDWYHTTDHSLLVSSSLMASVISNNVANSIQKSVTQASVDHTSSSSGGGWSSGGGGGGFSFSGGGGGGGGGGSW